MRSCLLSALSYFGKVTVKPEAVSTTVDATRSLGQGGEQSASRALGVSNCPRPAKALRESEGLRLCWRDRVGLWAARLLAGVAPHPWGSEIWKACSLWLEGTLSFLECPQKGVCGGRTVTLSLHHWGAREREETDADLLLP